ncbi:MAG: hypothetical protein IJ752_03955 [Alphaproteobacteria bacterium]|nr:hypothetical protein [Alphaproteobacteria bacterium]
MKIKLLFFISLLLGLSACAYQDPQIVIIDSNVSAFVYQGDKRLGETPYIGKVERGKISSLILKKPGYNTVKVPVEKVYSRNAGPLTSEYTHQGLSSEDNDIEGGVISSMFFSLPLFTATDMTMFANGYWIEYMPNSFYVEMTPSGTKKAAADILHTLQIKNFALKMYPSLAAGNQEALAALSKLSDRSSEQLETLLVQKADPVSFAEAVCRF